MNQIINHKNKYYFKTENGYREILSSTDTLFGLPQPSQQFIERYIEEYNKGNKITDVLVEVININNIYITVDDLDSLNCTDFTKVSTKYGFKYLDDFWEAMNDTLFLIDGYKVYKIKTVQNHDVYQDYLKGDFLFEITEFEKNYQLKLDSQNQITIRKQKNNWTRDEVIGLLIKYGVDVYIEGMHHKQWIDKNL